MKSVSNWFSNPDNRKYVYSIVPVLATVLVGYGLFSDAEASNLIALVGAILGIPVGALALANTPTSGDDE